MTSERLPSECTEVRRRLAEGETACELDEHLAGCRTVLRSPPPSPTWTRESHGFAPRRLAGASGPSTPVRAPGAAGTDP